MPTLRQFLKPATVASESPIVSAFDILRSRKAWRRHAPRRYWGLVDAPRVVSQPEERGTRPRVQ